MRNYIFEFDQQIVLRLGLKLNDLLFLDYLLQFVNSDYMRYKFIDQKRYYKITYKKILEDLLILNIKERQIRNLIAGLEKKEVIQRLSGEINELHLFINFDVLFGNKMPAHFDLSEIGFHDEGNGLLTIDYYDIKKIKIILNNARVKDLDKTNLYNNILANLRLHLGEILYKGFVEDKVYIDEITDSYILFDVTNIKILAKDNGKKFKDAIDLAISQLLSQEARGRSNL